MKKSMYIQACRERLEEKINDLKSILNELNESVSAETKSTAGDKHETGRAMIQLEQEKTGQQLKEAEEQFMEFEKINFDKPFLKADTGALIETDKGIFLIAVSLGKLPMKGASVFVISEKSPLGNALKGRKQSDHVSFNQVTYKILNIV